MAKTKISEFSSTPSNNTDIDSINIAEGCAPSGINDAIRELMAQLKDWQSGTSNDPYVVGSSGSLTLNQGTANGIPYLNGSKVVTSGSALTFDGSTLATTGALTVDGNTTLGNASTDAVTVNGTATFNASPVISVTDNTNAALRITQLGTGNALLVEDSTNPDSSPFVIDASGDVGIGTTTPDSYNVLGGTITAVAGSGISNLSIVSGASSTGNILFADGTTGDERRAGRIAYDHSVNNLYFFTDGNSLRATLDSSGNMGLGVVPSAWSSSVKALEIGRIGNGFVGLTSGSNSYVSAGAYFDGTWEYSHTGVAAGMYSVSSAHAWYTAASGTAGAAITFTQAMTLDASGRLLIGATSSRTNNLSSASFLQLEAVNSSATGALVRNSADTSGAGLILGKSRGTSVGSVTAVASGDRLGTLSFSGTDGTSMLSAATIISEVDGTPGTNDMPGRLVFSTTADGASTPTERMRIDNLGRVGINSTALTGYQVRIAGTYASTDTNPIWLGLNGTIPSTATGQAYGVFSGTATAATAFTLTGLNHFFASQGGVGAGSTITNQYGFRVSSNLTGATNNYGFYSDIPAATGDWNFYANGTADNYFAGNVGIGNTAPASVLDIQRATATTNATAGILTMRTGCSGTAAAGLGSYINFLTENSNGTQYETAYIGAATESSTAADKDGYIFFSTALNSSNPTERIRINSSGDLLVNATSAVSNEKLFVTTNAAQNIIGARLGASGSNATCFLAGNATGATSFDYFGAYNGSGTKMAGITSAGTFQSATNTYGGTSDERLKENITDATPKLNDLLNVRIRNFNFKSDEQKLKQIGVIAQELETVFPALVEDTPTWNEQGESTGTVKNVKYSVFVPMLIKAMQEQQAIITALTARVAALETN